MANQALQTHTETEVELLRAAQSGDQRAFEALTAPHRRELHVHCYRMLGSIDDADDAMQETMLRSWRQIERFEPRAPFRAWLYRIATNVCLMALEKRARLGEVPWSDSVAAQPEDGEETMLDPYPDSYLDDFVHRESQPETTAITNESIELAFIAAVQHLPPRQRATLLLRDVIGYSASDVAEMLASTTTGINSALQRARATLETERNAGRIARQHLRGDTEIEDRLVNRLLIAWHAADVRAIVSLLSEDALFTMPPESLRVVGKKAISAFLSTVPDGGRLGNFRLVPIRANRQPALAMYHRAESGAYLAHAVVVVSIAGNAIASMTRFVGPNLFEQFGLPPELDHPDD
jgi:RNA polymerase sigma-70 factor (ECF subfamily)